MTVVDTGATLHEFAAAEAALVGLNAAPGVVVGVLLIIAAIMWFSPVARHKFRKTVLWLVIAAIAMMIIFGYLRGSVGGDGA